MKASLSGLNPKLVTLQGEEICMSPCDLYMLRKGFLNEQEFNYITSKYPELMGGFWGSLTKLVKRIPVVGDVIKTGEGIADELRSKKKTSTADVQATAVIQQQAKQKEDMQKYLMFGIPAAIGLLLLLRR